MEHFNVRFYESLMRCYLHINPDELSDTEWAMRAGESFLMMKVSSPNWNSSKDE